MKLFNKFLKKKLEFEADLYTLKNGESTPFLLDAKLSVNKNEITIHNSSKKCIFYEENIYDFKYHEIDMCHFNYLCNNVVEEYGIVFDNVSGMYNFYKYIMYSYLKGNIILCRNVNLYKYVDLKKQLYKQNYYGLLLFNTDKCEHLLVVVKSNKEEKKQTSDIEIEKHDDITEKHKNDIITDNTQIDGEKREDNYDKTKKKNDDGMNEEKKEQIDTKQKNETEEMNAECEKYYKEVTVENLRNLYKRNKIFLVYVLNTYNDVYLSNESIGIYTKKYTYKNCYKYIEYKSLYSDGESFKRFFVNKDVHGSKKKAKENDKQKTDSTMHVSKSKGKSAKGKKAIDSNKNESKAEENNKVIEKNSNSSVSLEAANNASLENLGKNDNMGMSQNVETNEVLKWNEKVLIIFDSDSILIDYIKKILTYRYDFNNDVLNIKKDYLNTQTTIGFDNSCIDVDKIEDRKNNRRGESLSDEEVEYCESESEIEIDKSTEDNTDMKYKCINVSGKYSFVLRQNYLPPRKNKEFMPKKEENYYVNKAVNYDHIKNDLNIYLFDEYGKENMTYNSGDKVFQYKDEKCVPINFQINDEEGNKLIFLDETNDKNLFMMDVNTEKIVKKWNTENIPIAKLLKKTKDLYCGYNRSSLYYVDTRMKNCVQNLTHYSRTTPDIEHAAIDESGHILVANCNGELKYYDGKINADNAIKKSKNVIYCAKNIVHITTTSDGKYSVVTCEKSVTICENYVDEKMLFEKVIKVEERVKQKKICLQMHYIDVFTNNLGDYKFIRSNISDDNNLIFTFAKKFYVIWNFKEALNENISYVIKKTDTNISDLSFFSVNNVQGIVLATENKLTAKKITDKTIKQFKVAKS